MSCWSLEWGSKCADDNDDPADADVDDDGVRAATDEAEIQIHDAPNTGAAFFVQQTCVINWAAAAAAADSIQKQRRKATETADSILNFRLKQNKQKSKGREANVQH